MSSADQADECNTEHMMLLVEWPNAAVFGLEQEVFVWVQPFIFCRLCQCRRDLC